MSHMLSNWEQVHADIEVAADRSRVLWPEGRTLTWSNAPIYDYQPGIVLQNPLKRN